MLLIKIFVIATTILSLLIFLAFLAFLVNEGVFKRRSKKRILVNEAQKRTTTSKSLIETLQQVTEELQNTDPVEFQALLEDHENGNLSRVMLRLSNWCRVMNERKRVIMNKKTTTITDQEFEEICENRLGWCTHCNEFTAVNLDPDAVWQQCEYCGHNGVLGAEKAFLLDMFFVTD